MRAGGRRPGSARAAPDRISPPGAGQSCLYTVCPKPRQLAPPRRACAGGPDRAAQPTTVPRTASESAAPGVGINRHVTIDSTRLESARLRRRRCPGPATSPSARLVASRPGLRRFGRKPGPPAGPGNRLPSAAAHDGVEHHITLAPEDHPQAIGSQARPSSCTASVTEPSKSRPASRRWPSVP